MRSKGVGLGRIPMRHKIMHPQDLMSNGIGERREGKGVIHIWSLLVANNWLNYIEYKDIRYHYLIKMIVPTCWKVSKSWSIYLSIYLSIYQERDWEKEEAPHRTVGACVRTTRRICCLHQGEANLETPLHHHHHHHLLQSSMRCRGSIRTRDKDDRWINRYGVVID